MATVDGRTVKVTGKAGPYYRVLYTENGDTKSEFVHKDYIVLTDEEKRGSRCT
jgi:hypothetical protein